jgi:hypothetical protein
MTAESALVTCSSERTGAAGGAAMTTTQQTKRGLEIQPLQLRLIYMTKDSVRVWGLISARHHPCRPGAACLETSTGWPAAAPARAHARTYVRQRKQEHRTKSLLPARWQSSTRTCDSIMALAGTVLSQRYAPGSATLRRQGSCSRRTGLPATPCARLTPDGPSVAIVGTTGAVGQEFLSVRSRRRSARARGDLALTGPTPPLSHAPGDRRPQLPLLQADAAGQLTVRRRAAAR